MADMTINVSQFFAVGTSIGAYPKSAWREHELPPSGTPKGSATASANVGASGTVAFTGLADDTRYFATDASGTKYVSFSTHLLRPAAQLPIVQVTQAEYDALTPDPRTLYVISG